MSAPRTGSTLDEPRRPRRLDLDALLEAALARCLPARPAFPPLFVVGAPRSGTTLAYQLVVNRFRVAYLPNVSKRHPRAPTLAALRGRLLHGVPVTWESDRGVVAGRMAPSDGSTVLRRWIPEYDDPSPPPRERFGELRAVVARLERIFGGPFVNKNNPISTRIELLDEVFPDALFLHVRRDWVDTAVSLVKARRASGVEPGSWWGAAPPQYHGRRFGSELEQSARTVEGTDLWLEQRLAELPAARSLAVDYAELCAGPEEVARAVRELFARHGVRLADRLPAAPARFEPPSRARAGAGEDPLAPALRALLEDQDEPADPRP